MLGPSWFQLFCLQASNSVQQLRTSWECCRRGKDGWEVKLEAVLNDRIDIGPLDSYVHDLLKLHEPETVAKLRVVESTVMAPTCSGRPATSRPS